MSGVKAKTEVATILVAVRDDATRELLAEHLTAERFKVLATGTSEGTVQLQTLGKPDLVLLDLMLEESLETLRKIRQIDRKNRPGEMPAAVIVISGRETERDRIRGLAEGAADYIQRPYAYGELLARINAVLRRRASETATLIKVGGLEIDTVEQKVTMEGREVRLSPKEYALLRFLASEPRRVFSKEECLAEIWGYRSLGHSRTLDAHASRLRRKLDPEHGRWAIPCWGVGYRLC